MGLGLRRGGTRGKTRHARIHEPLVMAFLRNGCQQVGWPNYVQEIIIGGIIVLAVAMESRTRAVASA